MTDPKPSFGRRVLAGLRRAAPRMVVNAIRFGLSLILLLLYGAHLLGAIVLDLFLPLILALVAMIWFAPKMVDYIDTIEVGGNKLTLRDLKKEEKKLEQSGLLNEQTLPESEPAFLQVASNDPNLALAGLRIEIEKELRLLALENDVIQPDDRSTLGLLTRKLARANILTAGESAALGDLLATLNAAVHGADVSPSAADWAIAFGPRLLASLRKKHPGTPIPD